MKNRNREKEKSGAARFTPNHMDNICRLQPIDGVNWRNPVRVSAKPTLN